MRKKVIFLLDSLNIGGSQKKTVSLANRLAEREYDVHLVYLKDPDKLLHFISDRVKILRIGRRTKIDLQAMKKYKKYVGRFDISIVLAVNLYPMLFHTLSMLGRNAKPVLLVSINTTHIVSIKEKVQMILYRLLLDRRSTLIFGSKQQMRLWTSKYKLNKYSKVIYNGVDIDFYSKEFSRFHRQKFRHQCQIKDDEIVLGMVASFRAVKMNVDLIRAAKVLLREGYNIKVLFTGDGPKLEECGRTCKKLGIEDRAIFLGNLEDVRPALAAMDIFVLTSQSETFPNAALEAMAMSKPIIITNVGGGEEMIENGRNGFLYSPGDISELTRHVKTTIDNNSFRIMGNRSRLIVQDHFTIENMIRDYDKLLNEF